MSTEDSIRSFDALHSLHELAHPEMYEHLTAASNMRMLWQSTFPALAIFNCWTIL